MSLGSGDVLQGADDPEGLQVARIILHMDMDAFFASVEQRDHPELAGRPVIVGGTSSSRGVVCTASYEARPSGVHSGMPLRTAHRLCPEGVFVPADFGRYEDASAQIMEICTQYTPVIEKMGLDEAYLDLTGSELLLGAPDVLAANLQERIGREARLQVSIGLASGKVVAKIAANTVKPRGLRVVPAGQDAAFLAPLPVRALPGVGPRIGERLEWLGVRTIGQLAGIPPALLKRQFGVVGPHLAELAGGIDHDPVRPNTITRSIGKEATFDEDIEAPEIIERWILKLSDNATSRLRRRSEYARQLHLKLRLSDFTTLTRSVCLPEPTSSLAPLYRQAVRLFRREYRPGMRFRLVGISLTGLDAGGGIQLDLFGGHRAQCLDSAVDHVRQKFGDALIGPASSIFLA